MKGQYLSWRWEVLRVVQEVRRAHSTTVAEVAEAPQSDTNKWWRWRLFCTLVWECSSWHPGSGSCIERIKQHMMGLIPRGYATGE